MAIETTEIAEAAVAHWRDGGDSVHLYGAKPDGVDWTLELEVHTDKRNVKVVPCTMCTRPMVVSTFYVPGWAKCRVCSPDRKASGERGTVVIPQVGRTDPATAVDLAACLINRAEFEIMLCPFGHGEMELKSVNHNDQHGPSKIIGYEKGQPIYKLLAVGETVMHQCNECLCVVTMSTTAHTSFRRQNEVRPGKNANVWDDLHGSREVA